jgi:hypothetical protein
VIIVKVSFTGCSIIFIILYIFFSIFTKKDHIYGVMVRILNFIYVFFS